MNAIQSRKRVSNLYQACKRRITTIELAHQVRYRLNMVKRMAMAGP